MRHSPVRPRLLSGLALFAATAAMLLPIQQATAAGTSECASGGVKVKVGASPATVTVNDTTTSTGLQVVVTITGTTFAVAPVASEVTLTGATWCLKASTKTQNGTGTTGASTITNKHGVAQAISYVVVYNVSSTPTYPLGTCFENSVNGAGVFFEELIDMGSNVSGWIVSVWFDGDGTCGGTFIALALIVQAPDEAAAAALCSIITGNFGTDGTLRSAGYDSAPADYWVCPS